MKVKNIENMSTVPQTVGKSGRKKMRNDFHSGFESRVTVGNNNNKTSSQSSVDAIEKQ